MFDYQVNVTKLSFPGTLIFDHKGFPAIEMQLLLLSLVPVPKSLKQCEVFDGNGQKLYIELDNAEIVSCKIARKS